MFSLNEQEHIKCDTLDVIEVNEKLGEIKPVKVLSLIIIPNIVLKHRMLPESIIGHTQEFDDNTVH